MMKNPALDKQKGQALILVVIVLATVLTVGISVATRSVVNLRDTRNQQESQQAYSAAETGVEKTLLELNQGVSAVTINNQSSSNPIKLANSEVSSINVSQYPAVINNLQGTFELNNGNFIQQDQGVDIWFVNHKISSNDPVAIPDFSSGGWSGNITFFAQVPSSPSNCSNAVFPALQLIIVDQDTSGNTETKRYSYDKCAGIRGNGFVSGVSPPNQPTPSGDYNFQTDNLNSVHVNKGYFAHIAPLYTSTKVALYYSGDSGNTFPVQGNLIDSIGTSGQSSRKIEVYQGFKQIPSEFFYGLFAPINN